MTGRQGGVSTLAGEGRTDSALEVVGRGSPLAVSDVWKNKLRRLDTADMPGLKHTYGFVNCGCLLGCRQVDGSLG